MILIVLKTQIRKLNIGVGNRKHFDESNINKATFNENYVFVC